MLSSEYPTKKQDQEGGIALNRLIAISEGVFAFATIKKSGCVIK
jgi:hypothetical protein